MVKQKKKKVYKSLPKNKFLTGKFQHIHCTYANYWDGGTKPSLLWRHEHHRVQGLHFQRRMGALVGADDIRKTLPIENVVKLSRNIGKWSVETKESIIWRCFGGCKGKKLGRIHQSSLLTLSGDLEMSSYPLSFDFTLWKIGNVISWKGYFWQAPGKEKLHFHPTLW